jgi:hypothetical protein
MRKPIEITIPHIERIVIEKHLEEIIPSYVLTLWSATGEIFKLTLESSEKESLEFHDAQPDETWITPKVYKGSKNMEE